MRLERPNRVVDKDKNRLGAGIRAIRRLLMQRVTWPRNHDLPGAITVTARWCRIFMSLACAFAFTAPLAAAGTNLAQASDLATAAARESTSGRPIVLFFTQPGCPFCERARREYIRPLAAGKAWSAQALTFEVSLTGGFTGFDGRRTTGAELARSYGIRAYPTVLFVDSKGTVVAEPLVGFTVPDFYGAYLDDRLRTARERIGAP